MRFLLVDKIHELEPGRRIKASKTLAASEELFRDHLPGFPLVPGVLLTEMMAQAAQKCLEAEGTHRGRPVMARILSANFRAIVRPDQEVIIHANISRNRESYAQATCFAEVGGKKVCSAELFMVFVPEIPTDYRDEVLEGYWAANPPQRSTD